MRKNLYCFCLKFPVSGANDYRAHHSSRRGNTGRLSHKFSNQSGIKLHKKNPVFPGKQGRPMADKAKEILFFPGTKPLLYSFCLEFHGSDRPDSRAGWNDESRRPPTGKTEISNQTGIYAKKARFLILSAVFLSVFSTEGKVFSADTVTDITVTGPFRRAVFQNNSGPWRFELQGAASFQEREGKALVKSARRNLRDREKMNEGKQTGKGEVLIVKGPSAPLNLYLSSGGSVQITGWKHPVFISAEQGRITGTNNAGAWRVTLRKGRFSAHGHQGAIHLRGFSVDTSFKNGQGLVNALFNEGAFKVNGGKGGLRFVTDRGNATVRRFEGNLDGKLTSGLLTASLQPENVRAVSHRGDMRFNFKNGGTYVTAQSEGGKIYSPRYFFKEYSGKSLTVKGRIKGPEKTGTASLKTSTGNIYFQ